jgi:hypothetical protein
MEKIYIFVGVLLFLILLLLIIKSNFGATGTGSGSTGTGGDTNKTTVFSMPSFINLSYQGVLNMLRQTSILTNVTYIGSTGSNYVVKSQLPPIDASIKLNNNETLNITLTMSELMNTGSGSTGKYNTGSGSDIGPNFVGMNYKSILNMLGQTGLSSINLVPKGFTADNYVVVTQDPVPELITQPPPGRKVTVTLIMGTPLNTITPPPPNNGSGPSGDSEYIEFNMYTLTNLSYPQVLSTISNHNNKYGPSGPKLELGNVSGPTANSKVVFQIPPADVLLRSYKNYPTTERIKITMEADSTTNPPPPNNNGPSGYSGPSGFDGNSTIYAPAGPSGSSGSSGDSGYLEFKMYTLTNLNLSEVQNTISNHNKYGPTGIKLVLGGVSGPTANSTVIIQSPAAVLLKLYKNNPQAPINITIDVTMQANSTNPDAGRSGPTSMTIIKPFIGNTYPDLVNSINDFNKQYGNSGFTLSIIGGVSGPTALPNQVITQTPHQNAEFTILKNIPYKISVTMGTKIGGTGTSNVNKFQIPDLIGGDYNYWKNVFSNSKDTSRINLVIKPGIGNTGNIILSQNPIPQTWITITNGIPYNLQVELNRTSTIKGKVFPVMPNVVGMYKQDVNKILPLCKIKYTFATNEIINVTSKITKQSIAAGTVLIKEEKVLLSFK